MDEMAILLIMYIVVGLCFICYQVVAKDRSTAWFLVYALLFWIGIALIIISIPYLQDWGLV